MSGSPVTIAVEGPQVQNACKEAMSTLLADDVTGRLLAHDATLWGPDAEAEATQRLGWLDVVQVSRPLLPRLAALRETLTAEGVDRVVLCGMGGSSLAPEVICATAGVPLVVLDSTHPDQVRAAAVELERTVVVCSSKSGGTLETDSQRRIFHQAYVAAGIDPASRIVVVTDPGSPFVELSQEQGYDHVFLADAHVGGRYSALTAFGLVPSALAGVDVAALLDDAETQLAELPGSSAALVLAAALGGAGRAGRDKVVIDASSSGIPGFGDWAEQLVAESTGKLGTGLLPVVVEAGAPELDDPADDVHPVAVGTAFPAWGTTVTGGLGAQFLAWEWAVAVAGRVLGIDPFDQPDVESAKKAARGLLDAQPEPAVAAFTDGGVEAFGTSGLLDGVTTLAGAVDALLATLEPRGYLAVMAYLDRLRDGGLASVRAPLARRTGRPVTFGWGPRFLHSTGQFHKGGLPVGAFLQITGLVQQDLPIPDRPFSFGTLIAAQAAGDSAVLAGHGRPVLRLHVTDATGLAAVQEVLS